jgi:protein SPT2
MLLLLTETKRYRYADDYDDYDSGSDMEAAAFDVLEEEERSRRRAIKEDQEQEKIEKELAARKAAARKKTGSK